MLPFAEDVAFYGPGKPGFFMPIHKSWGKPLGPDSLIFELLCVLSLRGVFWLPECNPLHNRSLSPAVSRKPSMSTGYQRSGGSRRTGSDVNVDFPILYTKRMSQVES